MNPERYQPSQFNTSLIEAMHKVGLVLIIIENERIVHISNPHLAHAFGYTDSDIKQQPMLSEIIHPDDRDRVMALYQRRLAGEPVSEAYELDVVTRNGELRRFETTVFVVPGSEPIRIVNICKDITKRKQMERELATREQEYRTLLENTPDTIARYDKTCRRTYVNPAFAATVAGGAASLLGKKPTECPGGENSATYESKLKQVFDSKQTCEFMLCWQGSESRNISSLIKMTPEFDSRGDVTSILAVGRDITELTCYRQKIHQMAFYDTLTDLPNRTLFNDRLQQMIKDAEWHGHLVGVILLDLDRFNIVNDTLGHSAGDTLLCEVSHRLKENVRNYDTIARMGGDEFAILLPEIRNGNDLGKIAKKLLNALNEPFDLEGKELFVSGSIGISVYPQNGTSGEELLKQADSAMYHAKQSGRNTFQFFTKELTTATREQLTLENELRRGILREELELYFQPQVRLSDERTIGSEALIRWNHPNRGIVMPDKFIPIAENSGLIEEIDRWVLYHGCRTAREWNGGGKTLHRVSLNLSSRLFQCSDVLNTLQEILEHTGCNPAWIELEITENLLLKDSDKTRIVLKAIRRLGIRIALDDFGTGYSALSYLASFPIDTIKIDRSFTARISEKGQHAELVRVILSMGRILRHTVVAEGVETAEEEHFLKENGCHVGQGYYYSKPIEKTEFAASWLSV